MCEQCRLAYAAGVSPCTSIGAALADTRTALGEAGVPLSIYSGAEVGLTKASDLEDSALRSLALNGGPWVLVEAPLGPSAGVALIVQGIQMRGHRVLLAHPERAPYFHRDIDALRRLVRGGVLVQVTAGSLAGKFGSTVQRYTARLFEEGLVHNVSSDAHDAVRRPPGMREEMVGAGWGEWVEWMTQDVPAALLRGDGRLPAGPPLPERAATRRGLLARLRRT